MSKRSPKLRDYKGIAYYVRHLRYGYVIYVDDLPLFETLSATIANAVSKFEASINVEPKG